MTTTTMTTSDPQSLLRWSLRGNALFSTLSGIAFTAFGSAMARTIGLAVPMILPAIGLGLLGFAAYLLFVASRDEISLSRTWSIIAGDLAWVVGTIPVVAAGLLNQTGVIAAIAIAEVVLGFAALQYLGLRRARARVPSARH